MNSSILFSHNNIKENSTFKLKRKRKQPVNSNIPSLPVTKLGENRRTQVAFSAKVAG